jgi:hypothetical protein
MRGDRAEKCLRRQHIDSECAGIFSGVRPPEMVEATA